jgi:hypothetical protein
MADPTEENGAPTAVLSRALLEGKYPRRVVVDRLRENHGPEEEVLLAAWVSREMERVLVLPGSARPALPRGGPDVGFSSAFGPRDHDPRPLPPPRYCSAAIDAPLVWEMMSSTLKKRRAKMNKHKLRKRRKLERLKSK